MNLHTDLICRVFDYIPTNELYILQQLSKSTFNEVKKYIYFRCASDNVRLYSMNYLIEDNFINLIPEDIKIVIDKLMEIEYFCIAGGFPTQLYLETIPKESSDIDIFVLGGKIQNDNKKRLLMIQFYYFIGWFDSIYNASTFIVISTNIIEVKADNFPYKLQFIFTENHNLIEVLSTFDNSHNRCGLYQNKSYICEDTMISKKTMTTYFYNHCRALRYKKAKDLGFNIFNLSEDDNKSLEKYNPRQYFREQKIISLYDIYRLEPTFIKNWDNTYDFSGNFINNTVEIDIENIVQYEKYLEVKKNKGFYDIYIKYPTNIKNITIKKKVLLYFKSKFVKLENANNRYIFDYNKATTIKNTLLTITRKGNKLEKVPDYILETSCDLIGWENYLKSLQINKEEIFRMLNKRGRRVLMIDVENIIINPYRTYRINHYDIQLYKYFGYSYRDNIKQHPQTNTAYIKIKRNIEDNTEYKIYCNCTYTNYNKNECKNNIDAFGCWKYKFIE
jgi:hypothetical protein